MKWLNFLIAASALLASTCHANSTIPPQLEIHVPVAASSGGGITSIQEHIISKGTGFKLGDRGIPLDEAAGITVLGVWKGTDFVAQHRQRLDIHGDSYLVIKIDKEVFDKSMFERGSNAGTKVTLDEFGFSDGKYFTRQGDGMIDVRVNNGVFTQGNLRMELDQAYYGSDSFVGIEKRGIPIISYLYKNSDGTTNIREGKVRAEMPQLVSIKGQNYCRYGFTKVFAKGSGRNTDMYFFTMDGELAKYGYETMEIDGDKRDWYVSLFDVHSFSTRIPDKSCFINPPGARMVEKNSVWNLSMM